MTKQNGKNKNKNGDDLALETNQDDDNTAEASDELVSHGEQDNSSNNSVFQQDVTQEEPAISEFLTPEEKIEQDGKNQDSQDNIIMPKSKVVMVKKLLNNIKESNERLILLLSSFISDKDESLISIGQLGDEKFSQEDEEAAGMKIIEGVFDGENMIGPDGKQYSIPSNYASKSKLVEGDILKLTITANGTFVYKQIGPIERNRIVGKLERSSDGNYSVVADGKRWRILTASVTYFKGDVGNETVIIVPKAGESKWAAVENIIKKADNNEYLG